MAKVLGQPGRSAAVQRPEAPVEVAGDTAVEEGRCRPEAPGEGEGERRSPERAQRDGLRVRARGRKPRCRRGGAGARRDVRAVRPCPERRESARRGEALRGRRPGGRPGERCGQTR